MKRRRKWIQASGVKKHKGALHRALGYAAGEKIPTPVLRKNVHKGGHVGHMALFALNMRGLHHGKRRRRARHGSTR